jgi:hypothetical protein
MDTEARFTLDGSRELERHLAAVCDSVLAGIRRIISGDKLQGIALGGGYGRGEGGVLKTPSGDQPYNDLEFYVFVRRCEWLNSQRYARAFHRLSEELRSMAHVELEFKITTLGALHRSPPSLFYHDLVMGHRWLQGNETLFRNCLHHRKAAELPMSEATRLLMNRCSGLLFAREKLQHDHLTDEDSDFVFRNIAKTELALGDAVLIALGKYHWSCLERHRRLSDNASKMGFAWFPEVLKRHSAGVSFKLRPHRATLSCPTLQAHLHELSKLALEVWLWLENRRLGAQFGTSTDYVLSSISKSRGTSTWRNLLSNLKVFGPRALTFSCLERHPRERILNALAALLWPPHETTKEMVLRARCELRLPRGIETISGYRQRWQRAC